jgi:hypothetical protein
MKYLLSLTLLCGISLQAAVDTPATVRPMIWVHPGDRAEILQKIETQPWAKNVFEAMKARVHDAVAKHQADPDAFLRGLPLVPDPKDAHAHPTLALLQGGGTAESDPATRGKLQGYLLNGVDCGVLYFLTQDEAYASCAADILQATVEAMVRMKPSESPGNGGWIYPDNHLYEARALGAQLPLLYDFVAPYLHAGARVHHLETRQPGAFNFADAQQVFRTNARLAIEHGIIDANWPVLEMPSLTHNVLALDDPAERTKLLAYVTDKNTPHQDSLAKVVAQYRTAGAVWPESFQYSNGVSVLTTYLVALLRRQEPALTLPPDYANITLSLARLRQFTFPNGDNVRFGDSPRRSGAAYHSYEMAYALGLRQGDEQLRRTFGALINQGVAAGLYDRAKPLGHTAGAEVYLGPLQLLWDAPEIPEPAKEMVRPATTDRLPYAGVVLQRNLSPDGTPAHAFMAVVSGASFVHSHASGMALELYGAGEVLGTDSGKGTYTTNEHENYRRLFAAYNCVIVNGASRSDGGWVNLGIDTVEPVAMEPAVGASPVSPHDSFTLTNFNDDKGPGAKAKQERLVGIVRTSATTGYYVDVFRSESALPNQYHDYLYHNIGDRVVLADEAGALKLAPEPKRFEPAAGAGWKKNRSYLFPGWQVFEDTHASVEFAGAVTAEFDATKMKSTPARMKLFIPGSAGREYATAMAPTTKEAPAPYDHAPTPVLVIRQQGEAWTRPFAVIYEPVAGEKTPGAIQQVTALRSHGEFAGFMVVSQIAGAKVTQYVLVQPTAQSIWADEALGIAFTGRYGVITLNARGECTALYLGEGNRLSYHDWNLQISADTPAAAAAEIDGASAKVTSASAAVVTLPGGHRITSLH